MRRALDDLHQTVLVDDQLIGKDLHAHERLAADEGVASELLLRRVDGLHDVALFLADQFIVDGNRRIQIHRQLRGDGDEICSFTVGYEIFFTRR